MKVTPKSVKFGKVRVFSVKQVTLTLSNSAKKGPPITFGNPLATVPITDPQEFGFPTPPAVADTCGAQLLPKKSCKLFVLFGPLSKGAKGSTVTIFDNAGNANQMVPLSGTGK